ncbi:hypothetical protein GCM10011348_12380 [Marinobacterium nitratireducens]|uniref:Diguanylate cyclase/phosphodiesterase n=1 Tax=Marinobacterium nitratireducens TaxID=518897 RepID=A0A917ZAP9_9GAMM|nr:bifunctional diguanylate cyclase/phosphodiesterase [Marinobacterium nitratireducens]GGO79048.1 hypothetical protein GCM10011348_12380 [Marinobacterium nitratireducens]
MNTLLKSDGFGRLTLFEFAFRYPHALRTIVAPLLFLLMVGVYMLVYTTGGIKYVYSHSMYLVVLLGGFVFGTKGGSAIGIIAGVVLGPFMPIDTETGEMQKTVNWLYRTGFFTAAGFICGAASDFARQYVAHNKWFMRHDTVTGLTNRMGLIENLSEIKGGTDSKDVESLAVVSLENVAEVEAVYGLGVTDQIITQLARRMTARLGQDASLYRISNHQLAALITCSHDEDIESVLAGLVDEFGDPFEYGAVYIHGDVRIGLTELVVLEEAPDHYLRRAESALRNASEKSQHWMRFTPTLDDTNTREYLEILGELKSALASDQLRLHYQPKVSLATGQIHAVEALMRWQHPVRGFIPPSKFIPRAELSTMIDRLTEWAIDTSLAQHVFWRNQGIELSMAVNISTRNLLKSIFSDTVLQLLKKHQVVASRLELEITEASFMQDIDSTIVELKKLSDSGVVVSIDDFGTGYSSLKYLNMLPASVIKIDQSFIRSLSESSSSALIVKAAVNMAHDLGKNVIAEGVEEADAFSFLAEIGCDLAQGYLISKPLPAKEFTRWYLERGGYYRLDGSC